MSGQKFNKDLAKMVIFYKNHHSWCFFWLCWKRTPTVVKCPKKREFLRTWSLRSNSVTRQVIFNRTKIGGKCQNSKIKMIHFAWFSNSMKASQWVKIWNNFLANHIHSSSWMCIFESIDWYLSTKCITYSLV